MITRSMVALSIALLGLSVGVSASTPISVRDGDTVEIRVSARELTRISIEGAGRLDRVWGAAGVIEVQPDTDKGEIFIRPLQAGSFSFFVRDDNGATFTLVATQHDIPSQSILLRPVDPPVVRASNGERERQEPVVRQLRSLMRGMVLDEGVDGYRVENRNAVVPLWRETSIVQRKAYVGFRLVGEVYSVQNVSKEPLRLHENEFTEFGSRVAAVALDHLDLAPGEATTLYVIRHPERRGNR